MTDSPARAWRKRHGWTVAQLSDLTGFSTGSVADFETGMSRSTNRAVNPRAFKRYRLACAAVEANMQDWEWDGS